jgi:biotin carboxyl carrier protein
MKMENELAADQSAKVAAIHVAAGDTVEGGELLVELE